MEETIYLFKKLNLNIYIVLDTEYLILDIGYWILDTKYYILNTTY
jgi:hypothetical protein